MIKQIEESEFQQDVTMEENDPRQLDLFDERTARMARGRRAFEAFDLRAAKREFESCLALYPEDGDRASYLQAFLLGPAAVDLPHVKDPDVAVLPSAAENEYEIHGDCLDWVAAVGTVEGVFAAPMAILPGMTAPLPDVSDRNAPGRSFHKLITEERAARSLQEKVPLRQKMKALCPALFAACLERFH